MSYGLSDEIRAGWQEADALRKQRDELAAALNGLLRTCQQPHPSTEYVGHYLYKHMRAQEIARAALTKVTP